MTEEQRKLARHALGFPNKNNTTAITSVLASGVTDYEPWEQMVAAGEATKRTGPHWGGDDMFYLTLKGALQARDPKEHLSREDTAAMRDESV